jgi:2-haloacid dehalogenase
MTIKAFVFDAYGTLYDIQSVASTTDEAFPGYGEYITQVWRLKQLEYTWLRSLMGRYEDFWAVTKESLAFTLRTLGFAADAEVIDRVMAKYLTLEPYPDAKEALTSLRGHRLAILSNGSPRMLDELVRNTGLDSLLDATISIDAKRVFKPSPRAYELVEERLGVGPEEVIFVSSNSFDACGAKSFGFKVAWIERVSPQALAQDIHGAKTIGPKIVFNALRMQMEALGFEPDFRIGSLSELPGIAARGPGNAAPAA